jgi:hypothetical protein
MNSRDDVLASVRTNMPRDEHDPRGEALLPSIEGQLYKPHY